MLAALVAGWVAVDGLWVFRTYVHDFGFSFRSDFMTQALVGGILASALAIGLSWLTIRAFGSKPMKPARSAVSD